MNSFPQEKNSFFEVVACIALVIALSMTVACGVADAKSQSATESYSVDINSSRTVVHTHSGYVQGVVQGNLLVFRGIPYAAPPVGNLRWRPPQPPATWPGVRDASSFGNVCPQINDNNQLVGNEDCLVLNVFTAVTPLNAKQPVMVFFHGGGNKRGGTHEPP